MKRSTPFFILLVGVAVWLAGCKVSDEGTPLGNQAPNTTLTVVPQENDTANHYLDVRWTGIDPDGEIVAFRIVVDNQLIAVTTRRDTTLGFPAPNDGEIIPHTLAISAVDNEGLEGPAAIRHLYTINFAPTVSFVSDGSVPGGSNVGTGFRITLAAQDSNRSPMTFCVRIDDSTWNDGAGWTCSSDSIFLFADPTLHERDDDQTVVGVDDDGDGVIDEERENGIDDDGDGAVDEDTQGLFPEGTTVVANDALQTPGPHTIYARVYDVGNAVSPIISRSVTVLADRIPVLDTTVVGTYAGNEIYPDGSVYFEQNTDAEIVFSASAELYRGQINGYRYFVADSGWSDWLSSPQLTFTNLPPNEYVILMIARDLAGTLSDTVTFTLRIVEQRLTTNIVIVDETRNGPGQPGAANDFQVDSFYTAIFDGYNLFHVDYTVQGYVSPYNLKDAGLVMWHGDDKAELRLNDNTRILTQFLDKGGRLILSGWDVFGPFTPVDSITFATSHFGYRKLRAISALRDASTSPRRSTGFSGDNGFPGCQLDPTKMPGSWAGALDRMWTFTPRGETIVIGRLTVNNPGQNPLEGRPAAYLYDLSFRVAVLGVPLYFCNFAQAEAFMDVLIPRMLTGLGPG